MRHRIFHIFLLLTAFAVTESCSLDNYDAPNAAIYGSFLDAETGELVEQDIIEGTEIEYVESGYSTIQRMVVKNDGTYRNALIFANDYDITPRRGNFEPVETQRVSVKGETRLDFHVKPYVRIKNVMIFKNGDKVKAIFTVQQTGYDKLQKVALFVFPEPTVGASMFSKKVELSVGERLEEERTYTLNMDINSYPALTAGKVYFFRVGAIVNVPETKYNYASCVRLTM